MRGRLNEIPLALEADIGIGRIVWVRILVTMNGKNLRLGLVKVKRLK